MRLYFRNTYVKSVSHLKSSLGLLLNATYSPVHKCWPKTSLAGNEGNHQHFDPSLLPKNLWLLGRNFDDYPGFQPIRSWASSYAQDFKCHIWLDIGSIWIFPFYRKLIWFASHLQKFEYVNIFWWNLTNFENCS